MLMSMPVPVSPGLFLACHGDIKKRGRGLIGSISKKQAQNINAWTGSGWRSGVRGKLTEVQGKGERWGQPHRAWSGVKVSCRKLL